MIWRRWKRETRAEEEMEKGGVRDGVGVGGGRWEEGVEGRRERQRGERGGGEGGEKETGIEVKGGGRRGGE